MAPWKEDDCVMIFSRWKNGWLNWTQDGYVSDPEESGMFTKRQAEAILGDQDDTTLEIYEVRLHD